jgi:hypothetical protein
MQKTEIISAKVRKKTRLSTLPTLTQYSNGILSQSIKARERKKKDSNREGRTQIIPVCR